MSTPTMPNLEQLAFEHLASCFREMEDVRHAWATPPKLTITNAHMPCVFGMSGPVIPQPQSKGRLTVGRIYLMVMLILPFVAGSTQVGVGADATVKALRYLSLVNNHFANNSHLRLANGQSLPYLVSVDLTQLGDAGFSAIPIPGTNEMGSGIQFQFPIIQRAPIPRALRRI